jgi:UDP-N-acetylglucosamine 2-epimerase (non-hydrolysing)
VAHVEAGLRSHARTMPEEINRIVTDSITDYLLTPSPDADENLIKEGKSADKIFLVGNIMIDSLVQFQKKAKQAKILQKIASDFKLGSANFPYALITLHRPSNVDSKEGLLTVLNAFKEISKKIKLVFPIHPRTTKRIEEFGLEEMVEKMENLLLIPPAGYYDFLKLQMEADFILTDSGGIQEESTYFGIPCLTLRPQTERPITIWEGTNQLVKLESQDIIRAAFQIIDGNRKSGKIPEKWDGKTASRIVDIFRDK